MSLRLFRATTVCWANCPKPQTPNIPPTDTAVSVISIAAMRPQTTCRGLCRSYGCTLKGRFVKEPARHRTGFQVSRATVGFLQAKRPFRARFCTVGAPQRGICRATNSRKKVSRCWCRARQLSRSRSKASNPDRQPRRLASAKSWHLVVWSFQLSKSICLRHRRRF